MQQHLFFLHYISDFGLYIFASKFVSLIFVLFFYFNFRYFFFLVLWKLIKLSDNNTLEFLSITKFGNPRNQEPTRPSSASPAGSGAAAHGTAPTSRVPRPFVLHVSTNLQLTSLCPRCHRRLLNSQPRQNRLLLVLMLHCRIRLQPRRRYSR